MLAWRACSAAPRKCPQYMFHARNTRKLPTQMPVHHTKHHTTQAQHGPAAMGRKGDWKNDNIYGDWAFIV